MCTGTHDYIEAPQTIEARLMFSTPGGLAENVLNIHKTASIAPSDLNDLGSELVAFWVTELRPGVSDQVTLEQIILTDISTETGTQVTWTTDLPMSGTNTSLPLPMNVAAVISWRTGSRGRSYRGRTYHLGLCINATDASQLTEAARDELVAAYGSLLEGTYWDTDIFELAVVSRCQDGDWLTTAVVTPITNLIVDLNLDSQRRRLPGRGA